MRKDVTAKCVACLGGGRGRRHQPLDEAARQAEKGQGEDAGVWERVDPAGGVYRGVADGGGVKVINGEQCIANPRNKSGRSRLRYC